jgi:hypothetical protein
MYIVRVYGETGVHYVSTTALLSFYWRAWCKNNFAKVIDTGCFLAMYSVNDNTIQYTIHSQIFGLGREGERDSEMEIGREGHSERERGR